MRAPVLLAALLLAAAPAAAGELTLALVEVVETKAVFGQVQTRDVAPARARIGGVLASLDVTEGSAVKQGDVVARVVDDKLALQRDAADSRIKALEAEIANARAEFERAQALLARGAGTQQRVDQLRTQTDVLAAQIAAARAERAVLAQQESEGLVLSPATGRVLRRPVTRGSVVLPGDAVAIVAGGGFFVRVALPKRHAPLLREGAEVEVVGRPGAQTTPARGRLARIYPEIEGGRVLADVDVQALGDFFVGERVLVRAPVAVRKALLVPRPAVATRSGIDFVRLATPDGPREIAVVLGETRGGDVEILSGLRAGDRIVTP
ncbi:MAG TPA: efflux RND transporter periplasmic adaptor subunit [Beijerinckiaceae bacterium]